MTRIRSRFILRQTKNELRLERSPLIRLFNALGCIVLIIIISWGNITDLKGIGIIILFFLLAAFLYNSAANTCYRFSRQNASLSIINSFLGLHYSIQKLPIDNITSVFLYGIEYNLHNQNNKRYNNRSQNHGLYTLQLIVNWEDEGAYKKGAGDIVLDRSSDHLELERYAHAISNYLKIPFDSSLKNKTSDD